MTLKECLDTHISRWEENLTPDSHYLHGMIDAYNLLIEILPEWSLYMELDNVVHLNDYGTSRTVYVPTLMKLPTDGNRSLYTMQEVYVASIDELVRLKCLHGMIFTDKNECEDWISKENNLICGRVNMMGKPL